MDTQTILHDAAELELWMTVPGQVKRLYKAARSVAATVQKVTKYLPASNGYGYVYYNPDTRALHAVLGDGDDTHHNRWHNALKAIKGISSVVVADEYHPKDQEDWVRVKKGAASLGIGNPINLAGKLTGGPSPLTNALVGGLLTGGLGYGTGWLLERLFPERFVRRGRLSKTMGAIGAGLGTVPGVWQGVANYQNASQAGKPMGIGKTMITPHANIPNNPQAAEGIRMQEYLSGPDGGPDFDQERVVSSEDLTAMRAEMGNLPPASERFVRAAEELLKCAADGMHTTSAGGGGLQSIPMDAFNRAIWNDVRAGMTASRNPYGTKSPWGNNEQSMHTPPGLGAATAGLVGGIQSMYGNPSALSPSHFVRGLATSGVDLVTARVVGGALGALGGLSPAAQDKLQDIGVWGGLIRGTVGSMLGIH